MTTARLIKKITNVEERIKKIEETMDALIEEDPILKLKQRLNKIKELPTQNEESKLELQMIETEINKLVFKDDPLLVSDLNQLEKISKMAQKFKKGERHDTDEPVETNSGTPPSPRP